jgi:hypothetical protein
LIEEDRMKEYNEQQGQPQQLQNQEEEVANEKKPNYQPEECGEAMEEDAAHFSNQNAFSNTQNEEEENEMDIV